MDNHSDHHEDLPEGHNDDIYQSLKKSHFKQQKLAAWRPIPTITSTTSTLLIFSIVFSALGIVVCVYSNNSKERIIEYKCRDKDECEIDLKLLDKLEAPIMVYYRIDEFFQNHRRYIKSFSSQQLIGKDLSASDLKSDCDPVLTNKDLIVKKSISGKPLVESEPANPCGLIAKTFYDVTFTITNHLGNKIEIDDTNITWETDKDERFKLNNDLLDKYWINPTNQHFINWMRPAAFPSFKKLWGKIHTNLEPGAYTIKVQHPYRFILSDPNIKTYFVMNTKNSFGEKNFFLGVSFICVGIISLILAILFYAGYKSHTKTV